MQVCHSQSAFPCFIISAQAIEYDPKKVLVIQSWQTPTNITKVHNFHGVVNFYKWFVHGFSMVMNPITNYLRQKYIR